MLRVNDRPREISRPPRGALRRRPRLGPRQRGGPPLPSPARPRSAGKHVLPRVLVRRQGGGGLGRARPLAGTTAGDGRELCRGARRDRPGRHLSPLLAVVTLT